MFKFDLLPNEQLLVMYRKSELTLTKTVFFVFIFIYGPWYYLLTYGLYYDFRFWILGWTAVVGAYAVYNYFLWLVNVYAITSKRLINFHYSTLFHKHVLETPLERIVNVSFKTTGLLSSLLNFGDVEVQVHGLSSPIILKSVREAGKVKDLLWQLHHHSSNQAR